MPSRVDFGCGVTGSHTPEAQRCVSLAETKKRGGQSCQCSRKHGTYGRQAKARHGRPLKIIKGKCVTSICETSSRMIPGCGQRMTAEAAGVYLDYSKNRIGDETLMFFSIWQNSLVCVRASTPCFAARRSTSPKIEPSCMLRFGAGAQH